MEKLNPVYSYSEKIRQGGIEFRKMFFKTGYMAVRNLIMIVVLAISFWVSLLHFSDFYWNLWGKVLVVAFHVTAVVLLLGIPLVSFVVRAIKLNNNPGKYLRYNVIFEKDRLIETEKDVIYTFYYTDIKSLTFDKAGDVNIYCEPGGDLRSFQASTRFFHLIVINKKCFKGDTMELYRFLKERKGGKAR